jgi:hypothetical protein
MKTNSIFATLLVGIAILIYGCKQSSTQLVTPKSEWVEITDTIHLPDIWLHSSPYSSWERFTGLVIRDTIEYNSLATMLDTSVFKVKDIKDTNNYPIKLPPSPDFSKYSMVGLRYFGYFQDTMTTAFYVNDGLKEYLYAAWSDVNINKFGLRLFQNWILVPKLKQGYSVTVIDTVPTIRNNN